MDFKFCLLAPCSESPSLAMQKFRDDVTAHAHLVQNWQFSVTKNRTEQEGHHGALGKPFHFEFSNSNSSAIPAYFKTPFWQMIDPN